MCDICTVGYYLAIKKNEILKHGSLLDDSFTADEPDIN